VLRLRIVAAKNSRKRRTACSPALTIAVGMMTRPETKRRSGVRLDRAVQRSAGADAVPAPYFHNSPDAARSRPKNSASTINAVLPVHPGFGANAPAYGGTPDRRYRDMVNLYELYVEPG
jgi:hypothetical protein